VKREKGNTVPDWKGMSNADSSARFSFAEEKEGER